MDGEVLQLCRLLDECQPSQSVRSRSPRVSETVGMGPQGAHALSFWVAVSGSPQTAQLRPLPRRD